MVGNCGEKRAGHRSVNIVTGAMGPVASPLDSVCAAVAFRAAPKVKIGAVCAIDMATLVSLTLQGPNVLIVVSTFESCLEQQPLPITVEIANFGQAPILLVTYWSVEP